MKLHREQFSACLYNVLLMQRDVEIIIKEIWLLFRATTQRSALINEFTSVFRSFAAVSFLIRTAPAGLASREQKETEIRSALFLSGRVTWMIWGPIDNFH